jgi:hypothetical protein
MTMNEFIRFLKVDQGWSEWRIAALLNRTVQHICNVVNNHYPPSRHRPRRLLGDPEWLHAQLPNCQNGDNLLAYILSLDGAPHDQ